VQPGTGCDTNFWEYWFNGQLQGFDYWTNTYYLQPTTEPKPWRYVRLFEPTSWGDSDWGGWSTFTNSHTTTIELRTGGEPGSSDLVDITLWVTATNSTGERIDPSLITILGQTPDANGYFTYTTNQ